MIIYLSGPISNNPGFVRAFQAAERKMQIAGYIVINPADLRHVLPLQAMSYEQIMDFDFALVRSSDAICMLPGWEHSNGCNRELGYAQALGKQVIYLEEER